MDDEHTDAILAPQFEILESCEVMLRSPEPKMLEQIIWLFSNLIGENLSIRDMVIQRTSILEVMKDCCFKKSSISMMK